MKSQEKQPSSSALKFVKKTASVLAWPACSAGAALDTLKETPDRMCLTSQAGNRGCNLLNKRYEQIKQHPR
jgi:hypothetical protein